MSIRPQVGPVITERQIYPLRYGHPLCDESSMQKLGLLVLPRLARIVLRMLRVGIEVDTARKFAEREIRNAATDART